MNFPGKSPIGLLLPEIGSIGHGIFRGVEAFEAETGRSGRFSTITSWRASNCLDGVVGFVGRRDLAKQLATWGRPAINFSARYDDLPFPRVTSDDARLASQAAEALIVRGARRIWFVAPRFDGAFVARRWEGVESACRAAGVETECVYFSEMPWATSMEDNQRLLKEATQWLSSLPERPWVVAANPAVGAALWHAGEQIGRAAGESMALIQLEDSAQARNVWVSDIAWSPQNWERVGYLAARAMTDWLDRGIRPPVEELVAPLPLRGAASMEMGAEKSLVERARIFLRYSEDYTLGIREVAAAVGVSESTLYRAFRREAGHGLNGELVLRKLERGKRLLLESGNPVEDVAVRCGYSSAHNFIAAFRKEMGVSPGRWRREGAPDRASVSRDG